MTSPQICSNHKSNYCYFKYDTSNSKQIPVKLTSRLWQFNLFRSQNKFLSS